MSFYKITLSIILIICYILIIYYIYILLGFQFISVVIVLNMLIACMANTFTKVTDNVNTEWIFGRTEVYKKNS